MLTLLREPTPPAPLIEASSASLDRSVSGRGAVLLSERSPDCGGIGGGGGGGIGATSDFEGVLPGSGPVLASGILLGTGGGGEAELPAEGPVFICLSDLGGGAGGGTLEALGGGGGGAPVDRFTFSPLGIGEGGTLCLVSAFALGGGGGGTLRKPELSARGCEEVAFLVL